MRHLNLFGAAVSIGAVAAMPFRRRETIFCRSLCGRLAATKVFLVRRRLLPCPPHACRMTAHDTKPLKTLHARLPEGHRASGLPQGPDSGQGIGAPTGRSRTTVLASGIVVSVLGSRRRGILPRLLRAALLLDTAKKRQDAASTIPGRERANERLHPGKGSNHGKDSSIGDCGDRADQRDARIG
jgi:hypothetical protein